MHQFILRLVVVLIRATVSMSFISGLIEAVVSLQGLAKVRVNRLHWPVEVVVNRNAIGHLRVVVVGVGRGLNKVVCLGKGIVVL